MRLGLVSAILEAYNYEQMIDILAEMGFTCVEAACWPAGKAERRYAGVSHIDAARVLTDDAYAAHVTDYYLASPTSADWDLDLLEQIRAMG